MQYHLPSNEITGEELSPHPFATVAAAIDHAHKFYYVSWVVTDAAGKIVAREIDEFMEQIKRCDLKKEE